MTEMTEEEQWDLLRRQMEACLDWLDTWIEMRGR